MKYIKNYDSIADYKATITNAASKTNFGISMVEGKSIIVPNCSATFGDVVYYVKSEGLFRYSSPGAYSGGLYRLSNLVPIGVIAIPSRFTLDGVCRIVSLPNMSMTTPDTGSSSTGSDTNIQWGYTSKDISGLTNYTTVKKVNPLTGESTGTTDWVRIPSDRVDFTGYTDPISGDKYANKNYSGDTTVTSGAEDRFGPSPFTKDGYKNPLYYDTSVVNALSDFSGKENTQLILNEVTVTDWKTSSTLSYTNVAGNYPASECCWRFNTPGTAQGDWYLPACGELAFLLARYNAINNGLSAVTGKKVNTSAAVLPWNNYFWSSSECNSYSARIVDIGSYSYVDVSNKSGGFKVRAFTALNPLAL
jgi:hypothetical protein